MTPAQLKALVKAHLAANGQTKKRPPQGTASDLLSLGAMARPK